MVGEKGGKGKGKKEEGMTNHSPFTGEDHELYGEGNE